MNDYRRLRVRYVIIIAVTLLGIIFLIELGTRQLNSSRGDDPITDSLITQTYPRLYEAVLSRSADGLRSFMDHESDAVRKQAWRALAHTPVDSLQWFIDKAVESNMDEAWAAIELKPLEEPMLRRLEQTWLQNPELRGGISRVLGQQGDAQTLSFLLKNRSEVTGSLYENDFALAVGRLMTQHSLDSNRQLEVIRQAFETDNSNATRAYLYGFYRGDAQQLDTSIRDSLYQRWKLYGLGNSTQVDQYLARIIRQRTFYEITLYYSSERLLDDEIQLGVELARGLSELKLTPDHALAAKILVMHPNPIVAQQSLAALRRKLTQDDHLFSYTKQQILNNDRIDDAVWLQALLTAAEVEPELIDKHSERLDRIQSDNPYLLVQVLAVKQVNASPAQYLKAIGSIVGKAEPLRTQVALQSLGEYWDNLPDKDKTARLRESVRGIVFEALEQNDRGVAYLAQGLLEREDLFTAQDFNRINGTLAFFRLPEDIEVYQAFGSLYKNRFEQQARPVIDSLAALGYAPLNRSLSQAGWDVPVTDDVTQSFRMPDWEKLWELGQNPVWVLTTEKGDIKVQMDVLSAPATVSAIDSLTLAGAYEGVPFHRVVPNFVIQGGDIERQDGFGGPDFVLPTEASEQGFVRGAAGIASAGPDTEGSQYFFMHQWSPHLNGRYTLFGHVIEGMDVVDRITVGDVVERAYWE